ncbi:MAG TPA: glycine cleavage system protein H [Anaerolineae bacterium]|nr:glycine cleavage system protein H [Anaerolineae bacterium]HCC78413.1 glycine cleavage system protein H [Anaerolineae bacterium]HCM97792.1 glycine cleavage system protein H [Anaerolineae bacterium]
MSTLKFLETTIDKFIFKVAADRYYSSEGLWAQADDNRIRIGISDFLQQRSGDVAFAEVKPEGTQLTCEDEVAVIETIKVNISLTSPVTGKVIEINPVMDTAPEVINQDPFGDGWLAVLEATNWEADRLALLDAQAYFLLMIDQAGQEAEK